MLRDVLQSGAGLRAVLLIAGDALQGTGHPKALLGAG